METSRRRSRTEFEYELLDTGMFNDDRYFDVFVEYAKVSPEDVLIRITVTNRGLEAATLHVLPTLWFRNTWSWSPDSPRPALQRVRDRAATRAIAASHPKLGDRWLYVEGDVPLLFTENDTNTERLFATPNATPFVKDGIHSFVVHGKQGAVNSAGTGTKAAAHHQFDHRPGPRDRAAPAARRRGPPAKMADPFGGFDEVFDERLYEADDYYRTLPPPGATEDTAQVMRQALAGMLWSKQYYFWDANTWLVEHGADPFAAQRRSVRNAE